MNDAEHSSLMPAYACAIERGTVYNDIEFFLIVHTLFPLYTFYISYISYISYILISDYSRCIIFREHSVHV